jgi:alpha-tubulin suppressor-like RCC1 family protein
VLRRFASVGVGLVLLFGPASAGVAFEARGTSSTGVRASAIAVAADSSCALTSTGGVKCWGSNPYGNLGDGSTTNRAVPTDVSGLAGVSAISTGGEHTCALTTAGGVKCWGFNSAGQLGDGSTGDRLVPVEVAGLPAGVQAIALGIVHTCALTGSGGVMCWGSNVSGQLGDGATSNRSAPAYVAGLASGVVAISASYLHTCALTSAGGVLCWGSNDNGQLGNGSTTLARTPVAVSGLSSGVLAVAAGLLHTCALLSGGGVRCWGRNLKGQLGDGSTNASPTPVDVAGLASGVRAISAGGSHTCALTSAGVAKCWGSNANGQLGDGTTTSRLTPVNVSGLGSGLVAIAASSGRHSCALTSAGAVECWGLNYYGGLGDGTASESHVPVAVAGFGVGSPAVEQPCIVPRVKGKSIAGAKAAIAATPCSLGSVTRAYSAVVRRGHVISQRPATGTHLPHGGKVNLVVSRGKKP